MLGFGKGRIRTLVSMATDSSHRLTMGNIYIYFLRNHKAQSFHSLYVATCSERVVVLFINPSSRAPGFQTTRPRAIIF